MNFDEWLQRVRLIFGRPLPCPTMYHFSEFISWYWDGVSPEEAASRFPVAI